MKKTKVTIGFLVALVLVFGMATPAGADLVLNGNLESGSGNDPDNWTFTSWVPLTAPTSGTWDTSTSHSATHSYKMQQSDPLLLGKGRFASDRIAVTGGEEYDFSCWRKMDKTSGATIVELDFYDSSGVFITRSRITIADANYTDWTQTTRSFTATSSAVEMDINFIAYNIDNATHDAKYWMDDVSLTPEPATMTLLLLGLPFALRRRRK